MHVIPSCEIPSFCTTDASSHTGNARLEPHIGNAGESVAGILTEKSLVTWHPRTLVRTGHVSEPATSLFSRNFSDRPPASDSRGALQSLNVRNRRTRILLTRGVIALLRPPARQPLLLARSEYTCAHSCLRCNSLFAPAQAGRVALMLLPAHVLHAFCNLLIGR